MTDTTMTSSDDALEVALLVTQIVSATKAADGPGVDRALWETLGESGLTDLLRPAELGGGGAGWSEVAAAVTAIGATAARVPFAEHDLIGGWLLRAAGLNDDTAGIRTVGVVEDGVARAVPWARGADTIALLWNAGGARTPSWRVGEFSIADAELTEGRNLAGEARDDVRFDRDHLNTMVQVTPDVHREFLSRLSLARSLSIAGASDTVLGLVMEHAATRKQFGRPLSAFQAVQHMIADVAAEASLVRAAVDAAVLLTSVGGLGRSDARFAVTAAASCAGHASSVIVRNAHQVMGAMGYTLEHDLHLFTNRMLSWRSEAGSIRGWDDQIITATTEHGGRAWALIADNHEGRA